MSRSRKKTSITSNTNADSDKEGKKRCHKKFRRKEKKAIREEEDPPEDLREIESCWSWSKDGKQYFDEEKYPELIRK